MEEYISAVILGGTVIVSQAVKYMLKKQCRKNKTSENK